MKITRKSADYRRPQVETHDAGQIVEALGPASAYGLKSARTTDMRQFIRKGDLLR